MKQQLNKITSEIIDCNPVKLIKQFADSLNHLDFLQAGIQPCENQLVESWRIRRN